MSRVVLALLSCVLLVLVACGGDDVAPPPPDVDAGGTDAGPRDAGTVDAGGAVDFGACRDDDGDGHGVAPCGDDCDDLDPSRYPGNGELCDSVDQDCNPTTFGPDRDGDGSPGTSCCNPVVGGSPQCGTDCDDTRATINVTAVETCNGADDDCNGLIDEGVPMQTCYADADGDSYAGAGAASHVACACMPGIETVRAPLGADIDCGPLSSGTHPGAIDICDLVDNDCNGLVDDGTGAAYYADCDGDTFGLTSRSTPGCSVPTSTVTCGATTGVWRAQPGDCDDTRADIHPGATELCNGVDDDCNAVVDGATALCATLPPHTAAVGCTGIDTCTPTTCVAPYLDCTSAPGCETDPRTDVGSCGSCGHTCAYPGCTDGACTPTFSAITAGGFHTCGLLASGRVLCWGNNSSGELGDGTRISRVAPTLVSGLSDAVEISAGGSHTCARRTSGAVSCWGSNSRGILGDGTTIDRLVPTPVSGLSDAIQISAGAHVTCARRMSGAVVCWGDNMGGLVGDGTVMDRLVPTPASGLLADQVVAAGDVLTCAVSGGAAECWGADGYYGACGCPGAMRTTPGPVCGLIDASVIALGWRHACALQTAGTVTCWGRGSEGQLGSGTLGTICSGPGERVSGVTDAIAIAAGGGHTCALRAPITGGPVVCWGDNTAGDLGDGSTSMRATPAAVTGLVDAVEVAAGDSHTCARRATGVTACWGNNFAGQLGDGSMMNHSTAVTVVSP